MIFTLMQPRSAIIPVYWLTLACLYGSHQSTYAHGTGGHQTIPETPGWAMGAAADVSMTSSSLAWPRTNWIGTLHSGLPAQDQSGKIHINKLEGSLALRASSWLAAAMVLGTHGSSLSTHTSLESAQVELRNQWGELAPTHRFSFSIGRFSPILGKVVDEAGSFDDFQTSPMTKNIFFGDGVAENGLALAYSHPTIPYLKRMTLGLHRPKQFPSSEESYKNKQLSPSWSLELTNQDTENIQLQLFGQGRNIVQRQIYLASSSSPAIYSSLSSSHLNPLAKSENSSLSPLHNEVPSESESPISGSKAKTGCSPVGSLVQCLSGRSAVLGLSAHWDTPWLDTTVSSALIQKTETGTLSNTDGSAALRSKYRGMWLELHTPLKTISDKTNMALRLEKVQIRHRLSGLYSQAIAKQAQLTHPKGIYSATLALGYQLQHDWKILLQTGWEQSALGRNKHLQIRLIWKPDALLQSDF